MAGRRILGGQNPVPAYRDELLEQLDVFDIQAASTVKINLRLGRA